MLPKTPIVITGMGMVGDWGVGKENFIRFLSDPTPRFNAEEFDFDAFIDTSFVRRADHVSRCALVSAQQAFADAGVLPLEKEKQKRIGVIMGTVHGAFHYTISYHTALALGNPQLVSPLLFSESVLNAAVSNISAAFGIQGYTMTVSGYCSVIQAMQLGIELIEQGAVDVCLVGGADVNHEFLVKAYQGCLQSPQQIMQSFGGSGFLVMESLSHALQRKAGIYACVEYIKNMTASYCGIKDGFLSWGQELVQKTGKAFQENDCVVGSAYLHEDSVRRKKFFLQDKAYHLCAHVDWSNVFGYSFAAGEAFQIILSIVGLTSGDVGAFFPGLTKRSMHCDRVLLIRTALADANACVLFSRGPDKNKHE